MERIQHLVPTSDSGDNRVGGLAPSEGAWITIGILNEAVDRGLQRYEGGEHATFQPAFAEFGREAVDSVWPRCRGGGQVKGPARVADRPLVNLGMPVNGAIIDNRVDQLAGRPPRLDGVEEADELLVLMALHAAANHTTIQHVQRREQRYGAMPRSAALSGRARRASVGCCDWP